jgi:hypothetical protein
MSGSCGDRGGSRFAGLLAECPSTRCDRQPGGEDVDRGVDVRVCLMPAVAAVEVRLALAASGIDAAAPMARLGGVLGVDGDEDAAGCGLVFDPPSEERPRLAADRSVQPALLRDVDAPDGRRVTAAERSIWRTRSSSIAIRSWSRTRRVRSARRSPCGGPPRGRATGRSRPSSAPAGRALALQFARSRRRSRCCSPYSATGSAAARRCRF